jgi:hypothetical protein
MPDTHQCHAHGCTAKVPPRMFACKRHWFGLPKKIRDAIWREYRPGQENDKQASARYMAVQRLAVMHTAFKPHDEAAALVCAGYLQEALAFAELAKQNGQGNPLEGLLPDVAQRARKESAS